MRVERRWWWRGVLALLIYVAVIALTTVLQNDPDLVAVALVVGLLVAAASALLDSSLAPSAVWPLTPPTVVGLGRSDPRMAAHLRLVEEHLTAAEPDPALRDRLRALADQVLRERHELTVDDPRARSVLGSDLIAVLDAPPRRLTPAVLGRLLSRIESL